MAARLTAGMFEPLAKLVWEERWEALGAALRGGRNPNGEREVWGAGSRGACPPLYLASLLGARVAAFAMLAITEGAAVAWADQFGETALHVAARGGHAEIVRALGNTQDAEVDAQNNGGCTPLHLAAYHDQTAVAKVRYSIDFPLIFG